MHRRGRHAELATTVGKLTEADTGVRGQSGSELPHSKASGGRGLRLGGRAAIIGELARRMPTPRPTGAAPCFQALASPSR